MTLERRWKGLAFACGVVTVVALAAPARGATTNFYDGFETGLGSWAVGDANAVDTPAYWGRVDSTFGGEGTHGGAFKAYCAGTGYAGTSTSPVVLSARPRRLARRSPKLAKIEDP